MIISRKIHELVIVIQIQEFRLQIVIHTNLLKTAHPRNGVSRLQSSLTLICPTKNWQIVFLRILKIRILKCRIMNLLRPVVVLTSWTDTLMMLKQSQIRRDKKKNFVKMILRKILLIKLTKTVISQPRRRRRLLNLTLKKLVKMQRQMPKPTAFKGEMPRNLAAAAKKKEKTPPTMMMTN